MVFGPLPSRSAELLPAFIAGEPAFNCKSVVDIKGDVATLKILLPPSVLSVGNDPSKRL